MAVVLRCCVNHIVHLKGAVGEGTLENAHLPQPVLQISSVPEKQVRSFQVKSACSVWLSLKLKGLQSSIMYSLQGGKICAWRVASPVTSAAPHSSARPRLVSLRFDAVPCCCTAFASTAWKMSVGEAKLQKDIDELGCLIWHCLASPRLQAE